MARVSNPSSAPSSDHAPPNPAAVRRSRDREIEQVSRLWTHQRLAFLHGSPGVGKSALLDAGVIPGLKDAGMPFLPVGRVTHHTAFPLAALSDQNRFTFPLLSSWAPDESPARLADLTIQRFLRRRLGPDRFGNPPQTHLCIDQAELLFHEFPGRETQQARFLDDLLDTLSGQPNLRLLLVLRPSGLAGAREFARRFHDRNDPGLPFRFESLGFRLHALDRQAALRALAPPDQTDDDDRPGGERYGRLVDELRTIRTPGGPDIHTSTVDPSLLGIAAERLGPDLPEGVADPASEINRVLGEHVRQALATVVADYRLTYPRVEAWFRESFIDPAPRSGREGEPIPPGALGALEDKRLIKERIDSEGPRYEIQHPRLLEAMRVPMTRQVPRRPDAAGRLREAAAAFWAENLTLARDHVEGAVRGCQEGSELRAQAECLLGDLACAEKRFADAVRHFEAAAGGFERLRNTGMAGHLLAAMGRVSLRTDPPDPRAALQHLSAAASRLPHEPHVQTALGQALWQSGQIQAAFAALNEVLTKDGNNLEALRLRGELHADLGEAESALQDLGRVDHGASSSALSAWILASTLRAHEKHKPEFPTEPDSLDEAVDSSQQENGPVLLRVALVQELRGNHPGAVEFARRALRAQHPPIPPQLLPRAEQLNRT